jgi:hypothetical protein
MLRKEKIFLPLIGIKPLFFSCVAACSIVVVKALCYNPEGHGFETPRDELIFSIYLILLAALGPGVYSASNRNEYQKQKNNVFLKSREQLMCRADNLAATCESII